MIQYDILRIGTYRGSPIADLTL